METTEKAGDKAWELHNTIAQNEALRRKLLFDSMKAIHEIHDGKLYQTLLGDENAPWSAYLGQHELYYTKSQIYQYDKVYQKFVKELDINAGVIDMIPVSKLSAIVNLVNKENVLEWITKANELTSQDFQDEIRKAQGKESYLTCPHKNKVEYEICSSCSFRHKK